MDGQDRQDRVILIILDIHVFLRIRASIRWNENLIFPYNEL